MYFAAIYSKSLWVIYVFIFYLGVSLIGRWTCGFVMLTELIPEKYQTFAATALMTGDSAATLYLTFYYRFISKNSYPIFWVALALNVVSFIAAFWIPESIDWLIATK